MSKSKNIDSKYIETNCNFEITKINSFLRKINKLKKNIKNLQVNFDITKLEEYNNFFQSLESVSDEIDILSFKITGNKNNNLESKIYKYNKWKDTNNGIMTFMFLYQLGTIDKDYNFIKSFDNKELFSGLEFLTSYSKYLNSNYIPEF